MAEMRSEYEYTSARVYVSMVMDESSLWRATFDTAPTTAATPAVAPSDVAAARRSASAVQSSSSQQLSQSEPDCDNGKPVQRIV